MSPEQVSVLLSEIIPENDAKNNYELWLCIFCLKNGTKSIFFCNLTSLATNNSKKLNIACSDEFNA